MFAAVDGYVIEALYTLALLCICYFLYYMVAFSATSVRFVNRPGVAENNPVSLFLYQKVSGLILLGLLPAVLYHLFFVYNPQSYNIYVFGHVPDILLFALFIVLILLAVNISSRKKDMYERFPQMRISKWGIPQIMISIGGWSVYLLAYEYLFRGLLLFSWTAAFGPVWAIAVNLLLYSAFHIPNGRKEALGAIFFGLVLCLVSLHTGSFLLAYLLHLTLSASTEMHAVYFNPDMNFSIKSTGRSHMQRHMASK